MYKAKLNEMCQKRRWGTPLYERLGSLGPSHSPLFRASVTVSGATFFGPEQPLFPTLKEAHNEAARVALDSLASSECLSILSQAKEYAISNLVKSEDIQPAACVSSTVRDEAKEQPIAKFDKSEEIKPATPTSVKDSYKALLEEYAGRNNLGIPVYDKESVTMGNSLHYHASVTVGNQTFETPMLCGVAADAEEAVAKAALKFFTPEENLDKEDKQLDLKSYKNLLSELTKSLGIPDPKYETSSDGPPHLPIFVSTVEVDGERFEGDSMKTKRQAENSAAKVAWMKRSQRKKNRTCTFSDPLPQQVKVQIIEGTDADCSGKKLIPDIKGEQESVPGCRRIIVVPAKARSQLPEGSKLLPFSDDVWVAALIE